MNLAGGTSPSVSVLSYGAGDGLELPWLPATCRSTNGPRLSDPNGWPEPCWTGSPITSTSWSWTARATVSRTASEDAFRSHADRFRLTLPPDSPAPICRAGFRSGLNAPP